MDDGVAAFVAALTSDVYAFDGLLRGRAGILAGLLSVSAWFEVADAIQKQTMYLRQGLLRWNGGIFSASDQLLRLSTDIGTGSAGVLLMFLSVEEKTHLWLPGSISGRVRFHEERR